MSVDSEGILNLITEGFGIPRSVRGVLIRIAWVLFVTGHILWVCGWLAFIGVQSPFARADDFKTLQKNAALSATIAVQRELRDEYSARCSTVDPQLWDKLDRYIDVLQAEYIKLTGVYYPDPGCPHEHGR